jgi:flagellar basal body rod protein FlgG
MIKMMEAYRGFESAQKAIQSLDEITSKMVNDTGLIG